MIEDHSHTQKPLFSPGCALVQETVDTNHIQWLFFSAPVRVVKAFHLSEVIGSLHQIEDAVKQGLTAVGFITYEAAPAFDEALSTRPPGPLPLLWFGLYKGVERLNTFPVSPLSPFSVSPWTPSISYGQYQGAIERIKSYIAAGDTYQVNYTMRLQADFEGDPWALFEALNRAQRVHYSAYLHCGEHVICSASPELFFRLSGSTIICRPMKGTAPRGRSWEEDEKRAQWLHQSIKNRAENVMIVDMVRNDLGRIALPGSVEASRLFDIERYDTLFQMTSTVTALTDASWCDIMKALFPCASITGAPKVRTMEIIAELETEPRGIYTGCIGYLSPERRAQFNVAIRSVYIDMTAGRAEYGTGGGIVWDSVDAQEYDECHTKALVLFTERASFSLLETLLWRPGKGYFLFDRHLQRLLASGYYFGIPVNIARVVDHLSNAAAQFTPKRHRVRLLVTEDGAISVEAKPLGQPAGRLWRIAVAKRPVNIENRFLYHKTTHREPYETARADFPEHDDVLLWNSHGEITESTIANVVVRLNGELITPPLECGLLPGTYRAHLLESGLIRESIITLEQLKDAETIYLVNSVRRWIPATVDFEPSPRYAAHAYKPAYSDVGEINSKIIEE
jgi:para-aminobenzoate synthetase/4-amino-4-deoxychorismate lyase